MAAETFMTEAAPRGGDLVRRHRLSTRIWHWANAAILLILLMSGLMIFNAHPRLYWGQYGANPDPAWLEITAVEGEGITRIGGLSVTTTGVLGRWRDAGGQVRNRAFPGWATLPSSYNLALARRWHLTFAWALSLGLLIYAVLSLVNGHLRRDLLPRREELSPRHVWRDIRAHATLNFPKGRAALRYNILQKGSYLLVIFGLIPAMVLTGLTMSPAVDAAWPWLLDLFGGRQSARSIHFIAAVLLVAFVIVHLVMVLLAGPFNEIRSMITGRFRLPKETR
ncbi:Thiosulfate reductase cytochrome b subunit [Tranquillimonas rosea]|uniref:Thiosulfate reductase cytochrome b subunit n=1 Tax=Tranquillimonas rosea TaxID=641238 RepID=A0A1H9W7L8_9RHOB|nr:cytochrome b/b6 domain-containing protein [Tranquillimonas rosea]SES29912.1 Thiosulfate reductase cytochrome b subunit [Tranquillimonas rosea]